MLASPLVERGLVHLWDHHTWVFGEALLGPVLVAYVWNERVVPTAVPLAVNVAYQRVVLVPLHQLMAVAKIKQALRLCLEVQGRLIF